ncbi:MAG: hypothetical protein K2K32_00670, partial [Muribaculaceae bacterium]|nr:hypothetical protein [Muribaculaceae bacterium]
LKQPEMMKKVLYGVAMAFVSLLTIGSLQSCKDDLRDLELQTKFDVTNLQYQLDRNSQALRDSINVHRGVLDKLMKDLNNYATIEYVNGEVAKLAKSDTVMFDTLANRINGALGRITKLDGKVDSLSLNTWNRIAKLQGQVAAQGKAIGTIRDTLELWKKRMDLIGDSVNKNYEKLIYVMGRINNIKDSVQDIYDTLFNKGGVFDRLETVENRVDSIDAKLENLFNRFDALITGILIQGVKSPVFGEFNLPIGVRSNMLFNYYGYATLSKDSIKFPSALFEVADGSADPSDVPFGKLGIPKYEYIKDGYYADKVSLGEVYVTLNPIGHVFNDTELTLRNSKGEPLPIKVAVNPSDDLLTFGYNKGTRSTIESGLYKGEAVLDMNDEDVETVKFEFDKSFLTSIKDAFTNPTKQTALDLLKAVYSELGSKKLPAYALRYDWNVDEPVYDLEAAVQSKPYAVLSQYDLAVVAAQPFGFNVFQGYNGSSKELPVIGHIDNFVSELIDRSLNNFNLSTSNINVNGNAIGFESVTYKSANNTLMGYVSGLTVAGKAVAVPAVDCVSPELAVEKVTTAIVDAINGEINKGNDPAIKAEINSKVDLVLLEMQTQINKVVEDITIQIKNTFNGMGDDTQKYFDKLNRAAKLYDRFASKINNFLKNPKAYVQVCAFYDCNNSLGVVSNDIKHPTPLVVKGGDKLDLYLSSYTAELIAPAYKKYVAVCGVYNLDGTKKTTALGKLNKGPKVNKVLSGSEIEVAFNIDQFEKNYIYEFVYQAIDYRGYTSTQKFYIQVK